MGGLIVRGMAHDRGNRDEIVRTTLAKCSNLVRNAIVYGRSHDRTLIQANGATAGDNAIIKMTGPAPLLNAWLLAK
ncbi:hypothetical protein [Burkholderia sp. LMG 32019]|uniref:hypothetical protein n=1 Tax=Burkholderia sp. LMG 32019 TaxID=3158173 RepID=UPI003C30D78C